jgi:hypothetical protein
VYVSHERHTMKVEKFLSESRCRTPLPETITIWHTSPVENLESILKYGVTTAKVDFESRLKAIENSNVSSYKKQNAKDRLLECFDNNPSGFVCCSGDKVYSVANGSASNEWEYYLNDKDFHVRMICFKIVIPFTILENLTVRNYKHLIERFKELWQKGYFARKMWEHRKWNHERGKDLKLDTNPIKGYDHFVLSFVPPEFIKSYEVIEVSERDKIVSSQ